MFLLLWGLLLASDKAELIQAPSGSKSDHLEVQSGGLVMREGEAGSAFGTVKVGKGKRQLSYFLVVKHELGKSEKSDFNEEASADEKEGETKQTLSLDGKAVEIVYKVRVEGDKVTETLTVNKKAVDLSKGRVLLVDLTNSSVRWEQRKADLPAEVEVANKKQATEALANQVLTSLAKQDKKAKEFIDKAGR